MKRCWLIVWSTSKLLLRLILFCAVCLDDDGDGDDDEMMVISFCCLVTSFAVCTHYADNSLGELWVADLHSLGWPGAFLKRLDHCGFAAKGTCCGLGRTSFVVHNFPNKTAM